MISNVIVRFTDELREPGVDSKMQLIANGLYVFYMKNWIDVFGHENVLILTTEELVAKPFDTVKKFEKFFNLDNFFRPEMFQKPFNGSFYCIVEEEVKKWHTINGDPYPFTHFQKNFDPLRKKSESLYCLSKNKGRTRNKQKTSEELDAIKKLKNFYHRFNTQLFELIDEKFDWNTV